MAHFLAGSLVAFDTETTGLDPWHGDQPFAFSFANEKGEAAYFEWPVDPWTRTVVPVPRERDAIGELLEDPKVAKLGHNIKFDSRMVEEALGIHLRGRVEETMFMAHACNSLEPNLQLKRLANRYVDYPLTDQTLLQKEVVRCRRQARALGWEVAYKWKVQDDGSFKKEAMVEADYWLPRALDPKSHSCERYGLGDVYRTLLLMAFYRPLMRELGVDDVYERELELWPITYRMESQGVRLDPAKNQRELDGYLEKVRLHKAEIEEHTWKGFNINSANDLCRLIYKKLRIPVKRRTLRSGKPEVNVDALYEHIGHPVVASLFKYRAASKAVQTYFMRYETLRVRDRVVEGGWCIHANFNQIGPATGRYSCRDPNLQNVANALTTRSPEPIQARTPLGPRRGYVWVHVDYEQLEVRIFADGAQEEHMLDAIRKGADIHTTAANRVWGLSPENPAAMRAAIHALELDGSGDHNNPEVIRLWKKWGISDPSGLRERAKQRFACRWMEKYAWDMVKAEASMGKKTCRARAKMLVFLKVFGGREKAAAQLIGCPVWEARQILDDYDAAFPRIAEYMSELEDEALREGCIWTAYGRRLTVNPEFGYRCVNYYVQGSAADLLKRAMVRAIQYLKEHPQQDCKLVLSIHDELVYEVREDQFQRPLVRDLAALQADHEGHFGVPTPVAVEICRSQWNQKEKYKL
jgi:DNA polymerase I